MEVAEVLESVPVAEAKISADQAVPSFRERPEA